MRLTSLRLACLASMAAVMLSAVPARAQMESREAISLQNQILELRQQFDQMQAGGGGGAAAVPVAPPMGGATVDQGQVTAGLAPQLLDRVQRLEDQMRDLRGRVDELTNAVQQQNAALAKQVSDLGFAMQQGGHTPAPDAGAAPAAASAAPAPAAPPAHRTPEMALQQGSLALSHHDYAAAQAAAQEAMAGRGPRQADAQFLLGQALTGQHQYQQAAVAYYDAYNRAPRSGRAPDALLGVSYALVALGDKSSACQALDKLRAEFPSPAPKVRSASTALRGRAGCH